MNKTKSEVNDAIMTHDIFLDFTYTPKSEASSPTMRGEGFRQTFVCYAAFAKLLWPLVIIIITRFYCSSVSLSDKPKL